MSAPRAVLFDLDCTLVDRAASLEGYAARFADDWADRLRGLAGPPLLAAITRADRGGYAGAARAREIAAWEAWERAPGPEALEAHWQQRFPQFAAPMDGMRDTLEALCARGFALGVVTNGRTRVQNAKIDRLGIRPLLRAVVVSEAEGYHKPQRVIYARALARVGAAADETWLVGDHPENDALGAAAAGLTSVWLRGFHDWPAAMPRPHHEIDALRELLDLLPPDAAG